jgi:tRNA uridine 5-carboxymethylaminomethyl modification enzyme
LLRQDNALRRLGVVAEALGLLTDDERSVREGRLRAEDRVLNLATATAVRPSAVNHLLEANRQQPLTEPIRISELAKRPGLDLSELLAIAGHEIEPSVSWWASVELRYGGYLERERLMAGRLIELEGFSLPSGTDYRRFATVSFEAREKLSLRQPSTLGQASRIPGVSPSDLHAVLIELQRMRP